MVNRCVMFGNLVAFVFAARCLIVLELFLTDSVPKPVVFHVHGFYFLHDVVVDDASNLCVVGLNQGGRLGMTQELEGVASRDCFPTVDVELWLLTT